MSNNGYITIREASEISGVTPACIYKQLKKGLIQFSTVDNGGRKIKAVKKADIESFFNDRFSTVDNGLKHVENDIQQVENTVENCIQRVDNGLKHLFNEVQKLKVETLQEQQEQLKNQLQPVSQINNLFHQWYKENQDLKEELSKSKKEEDDLRATVAELKRQLEEERNKPWYKKMF